MGLFFCRGFLRLFNYRFFSSFKLKTRFSQITYWVFHVFVLARFTVARLIFVLKVSQPDDLTLIISCANDSD